MSRSLTPSFPLVFPVMSRSLTPSIPSFPSFPNIRIANQDVDIRKLADAPFVVLDLSHCKVSGLENIESMHIGNNRTISLHDCDVSGDPGSRIRGIPDSHHATYDIGGP